MPKPRCMQLPVEESIRIVPLLGHMNAPSIECSVSHQRDNVHDLAKRLLQTRRIFISLVGTKMISLGYTEPSASSLYLCGCHSRWLDCGNDHV